uniref:CCHC-type domain-containing protein n=1 Tax=Hucho hucho TaxID=62062 RepID=A0A4W5L7H3_9TELE
MAQNKPNRPVPGMGLANTLRFVWTDKVMEEWGRETFGRNILMGCLKIEVKDVLCLQGNPMESAYDVTFHKEEKHLEIMKKVKAMEGTRPLCHYQVTSLARNNFRVVTVNMYNPHVKDEEVRAFLGRYVDNVSSARYLRDSLGFWNGRRGFQVLLREDPKGIGGYLHPPAMFSLGADRGTLYYARQPPFCRRCMAYGHILASCSSRKCRFCGSGKHEAKDCDEPKACHGCGSSAHLWRDCPARQGSYASAAGGRAGDGGRRGREGPDDCNGTGEKTAREEEVIKEAARGEGQREEKVGTGGEEGKEADGGEGVEKKGMVTAEREEGTAAGAEGEVATGQEGEAERG